MPAIGDFPQWVTLALLFATSWLAATVSGVAGFGGALLLLPVLTNLVGVKAAVPILTIAQLWGNASRVWFGRTEIRWRPVLYFIVTAIPFSIVGGMLFVDLPKQTIMASIGILLIVIVALRRLKVTRFGFGEKGLLIGGALTGFLSGLAGSAGPLGAAFFLGLDLPALAYIASEAVTALAMHVTKTIVYQRYALIGVQELAYGLLLGVGMIAGSWTGKQIAVKLPKAKFIALVEVLLVLSALQLIFFAS
ncbi:MAG: sulfite exporter TauE/SafE family protein [Caldilinea sp.]